MSAPPGEPTPSASNRSGRPPGDGWDDGRGGKKASRNPWAGENGRLPRWLIPAGAGVVLLLVVGLVVVLTRGGDGPSDSGTCVNEVVAGLPATETGHLAVTDVVQARSSGYDDEGDLEAAGDSLDTSGAIPDGLTAEVRFGRLDSVEEFTGSTGVSPGDIDCSVRSVRAAVLGGTFDPAEVDGTDLAGSGRLAATDERLALVRIDGDPDALLEPADPPLGGNDDVSAVLESLRDQGAYSALLDWDTESDTALAAGLGVAGASDDERLLVLAWAFDDEGTAKAGRQAVVEAVNKAARGSASITVDDLLLDGSLVTASVEVRKAPNLAEQWDLGTPLLPRD